MSSALFQFTVTAKGLGPGGIPIDMELGYKSNPRLLINKVLIARSFNERGMSYKQFDVYVQDRPGEVSRVTEALAHNAVNIRGIATDVGGGRPRVHIITDDDSSARSALKAAQMEFAEHEVIVVSMADRPGELAKITKKLARGGININSLFMLASRTPLEEMALTVDRMDEAKRLLDFS